MAGSNGEGRNVTNLVSNMCVVSRMDEKGYY